jgi:hypothetical protein
MLLLLLGLVLHTTTRGLCIIRLIAQWISRLVVRRAVVFMVWLLMLFVVITLRLVPSALKVDVDAALVLFCVVLKT